MVVNIADFFQKTSCGIVKQLVFDIVVTEKGGLYLVKTHKIIVNTGFESTMPHKNTLKSENMHGMTRDFIELISRTVIKSRNLEH